MLPQESQEAQCYVSFVSMVKTPCVGLTFNKAKKSLELRFNNEIRNADVNMG